MIPENIVEEIRNRADIVEVVGQFLLLKKEGSRYKCCCPFHDEQTPSFYITPSMQRFKCFGCGEGGNAVTFVMKIRQLTYPDALRWLAGFYQISIEGESREIYQPPQRRESRSAPTLPPSFTDPAIFQKSLSGYSKNNLVQWLCVRLGRAVVMEAVNEYQVGTANGGKTVFWQVNHEGKAGTGKIITYPKNDHHRIKTENPNWVHSLNGWSDTNKYNWVKYWFGEHLLSKYPARTVAIVESEKTALVCSIYFERLNFVWIASCGKDGINSPEKWDVLKGRTVVLYPDLAPPDEKGRTPFQDWSNTAAELTKQGFNVSVNDFLETHADEFERGQKWDIGDFLLSRELSEFLTEYTFEQDNAAPLEQVDTNEPNANRGPINSLEQPAATLEVLPLGYQRKQYRDPHTGQPYALIINADGYPAQWDTPKPFNLRLEMS